MKKISSLFIRGFFLASILLAFVTLFATQANAVDQLSVAPNTLNTDNLMGATNVQWKFTATTTNPIGRWNIVQFILPQNIQGQPFSVVGNNPIVAATSSIDFYTSTSTLASGLLMAQNSNGIVIYGFATTTIPAGTTFSVTIGGISNPSGQLSSLSSLSWNVRAGTSTDTTHPEGLLSATSFSAAAVRAVTRAGGALVSDINSSITDSSNALGAAATITMSLKTTTQIPIGGKIMMNIPSDFSLQNATTTAADIAGISNNTAANVANGSLATTTSIGVNRAIFTVATAPVNAGDILTVSVTGLTNPSTAGVERPFSIFTTKSNNGLLDGSYFGFESSDFSNNGAPPQDTLYIGGKNNLVVQIFKLVGSATTTLSASDIAQVSVNSGCPDKQYFMGQRWLNSNGVANYSNILDCNYMLGVSPFNPANQSFFSSFLPPGMKTVNLLASGGVGQTATTTLVFAVPDATTTLGLHLPGAVPGAQAFVNAYSSDNQSFSKVYTDTTYVTPGFDANGNGYAIIPIKSGKSWSYNVIGGSLGSGANFANNSGGKYWPPTVSPILLTAATTTNISLGTSTYVLADQNLDVSLSGSGGGGGINNACVGVAQSGGGIFSSPQDMICQPNYSSQGNGILDHYRFKVPAGAVTVVINRGGFGAPLQYPVAIASSTLPATTTKSYTLSSPTSFISVSVVDGNGNKINGAPIFAQSSTGSFANGMTNSAGTTTLYVAPGNYTIQGFAPAFGPLTQQTAVVTISSNPSLVFTVNTGSLRTISGRVTQGGGAVSGLNIGANGTGSTSGGNGTQTDANGNYTLYVPSGTYSVQGWSQDTGGLIPQTANVTSGNVSGLNWALGASGTLRIEVQNSSNISQLFAGAFDPTTGKGNGTGSWTASSTGKVASITLPAGTYNVRVGSPALGSIGSSNGTVITAGATTNLLFNAASSVSLVTLSGSVTSSSVGVSGVNVWASKLNGPGFFSTQTDSNGNYSIQVPDATSYTVGARSLAYITNEGDVIVAVSGNTTKNFTLAAAGSTITGTIKDVNGNGIANAFVRALETGVASSTQTGALADASGNYSLSVNSASTWNLVAQGPCYLPSSPVAASAGNSGKNITLSVDSTCTVPTPQVQAVTDTSGGQVSNSNMTLNIPANALGTSQSSVSVSVQNAANVVSSANATPLKGSVKTITATNSSGQAITSLNNNASLVISYDPTQLPNNFDQSKLQLGYFDTNTNQWEPVAATVDTTNHTLTAQISHFTDYGPILPGVPDAPTNLGATTASASEIDLSWTASPTATTYSIYRSLSNSGFSTPVATGVTGTSYNDSNLSAGTQYYYEVSGVNSNGEGQNSSSASAATNSTTSAGGSTSSASSGGSGGGGAPQTAYVVPTVAATPTVAPVTIARLLLPAVTQNAFSFSRPLNIGVSGPDVSALQNFLIGKGYLVIPVGTAKGYFGALTKAALKKYQKSVNINATGVLGPLTTAAVQADMKTTQAAAVGGASPATLPSVVPTGPVSFTRTLQFGNDGDDVTALQAFLASKGYLTVPTGMALGHFGPLTKKAVTVFQQEFGIDPTGIVGPATAKAIQGLK